MATTPSHTTTDLAQASTAGVPLISIVVATFNRAEWLGEALQTLIGLRTDGQFSYEVIVVDNASTDDTRAVVESVEADVPVRYLYQDEPGDAPTRNCGVAAARGSWLAFFDDDQFAEPDWLLELYRASQQADARVIGGAVHLDLTAEQSRRLGKTCRLALRELKPYRRLQPYGPQTVMGCGNALVAREVFDSIGNFDTAFTKGGSDTNFFLRARDAGFAPWYSPQAVIRHRVPPNRLSEEYFQWDARQSGENKATHDFNRSNRLKVAAICLARLGLALAVHVPRLVVGWLRRDPAEVLDGKARLWRFEGYSRKTLAILAPRLFPQRRFFESLEFRSGRKFG